MIPGTRGVHGEEYFSDETLQKAKTARLYIEHLYRSQSQNFKERRDRYGNKPSVAEILFNHLLAPTNDDLSSL